MSRRKCKFILVSSGRHSDTNVKLMDATKMHITYAKIQICVFGVGVEKWYVYHTQTSKLKMGNILGSIAKMNNAKQIGALPDVAGHFASGLLILFYSPSFVLL